MNTETAQHTPGPWSTHVHVPSGSADGQLQVVTDDAGPPIAWISEDHLGSEANARLIAAAPEMLEALNGGWEAASGVVEAWEQCDLAAAVHNLELWIDFARAAIAKAEGRAE